MIITHMWWRATELTHRTAGYVVIILSLVFKLIVDNSSMATRCEIALGWMPKNLTDDKSILVHLLAWCRHWLSQCWPIHMSPNGVIRSQCVNSSAVLSWQCDLLSWTCQPIINVHRGFTKVVGILQRTFSKAFPEKKIYLFPVKFNWMLFSRDNMSLVQIMACRLFVTKSLFEQNLDKVPRHDMASICYDIHSFASVKWYWNKIFRIEISTQMHINM